MKLLLPYAYDTDGNLVSIDDVTKGQKYTCPACGAELSLKISKIPPGQKHHRRNHFAHKGNTDNHCSESFLHKLFKERCAEYIRNKIAKHEDLYFECFCEDCFKQHKGNLLKKAEKVVLEYDLGVCKPDIALLDGNDKVIIVIEIVVTHKPEDKVLKYYEENNIACLQINVNDFSDCDNIEEKLSHPSKIIKCPLPKCPKCGERMGKRKLIITTTHCQNCGQNMKIAMVLEDDVFLLQPSKFNKEEISLAKELGANIRVKYENTSKTSYLANICRHCNAPLSYDHSPHEEERDVGYGCFHCSRITNPEEYLEQLEKTQQWEYAIKEKEKKCPQCGNLLLIRNGKWGPFRKCSNYPNCKYTESIIQK